MTTSERRFESPHPDDLSGSQRDLYRAISGGKRAQGSAFDLVDEDGRLLGPFGPMLISPDLGDALQRLGERVRFGTTLTAREREIAILGVARVTRCQFERYAHERVALAAGMTADEVASLRDGTFQGLDGREVVTHELVEQLGVDSGHLTDAAFDAARGALGEAALYEVVCTIGYYQLLALTLNYLAIDEPTPTRNE